MKKYIREEIEKTVDDVIFETIKEIRGKGEEALKELENNGQKIKDETKLIATITEMKDVSLLLFVGNEIKNRL